MTEQTTDTGQVARWARREPLLLLLLRLTRGKLTHAEAPQLRTAVEAELTDAEEAHRRAERAEQQLANVRALHARDESNPRGPWCGTCLTAWPCPTATALDAVEQPCPDSESCCAHCGHAHDWNDCETYARLAADDYRPAPSPEVECADCGAPLQWIDAEPAGWWAHRIPPHDGHGPEPSPAAEREVPPCG